MGQESSVVTVAGTYAKDFHIVEVWAVFPVFAILDVPARADFFRPNAST